MFGASDQNVHFRLFSFCFWIWRWGELGCAELINTGTRVYGSKDRLALGTWFLDGSRYQIVVELTAPQPLVLYNRRLLPGSATHGKGAVRDIQL